MHVAHSDFPLSDAMRLTLLKHSVADLLISLYYQNWSDPFHLQRCSVGSVPSRAFSSIPMYYAHSGACLGYESEDKPVSFSVAVAGRLLGVSYNLQYSLQ